MFADYFCICGNWQRGIWRASRELFWDYWRRSKGNFCILVFLLPDYSQELPRNILSQVLAFSGNEDATKFMFEGNELTVDSIMVRLLRYGHGINSFNLIKLFFSSVFYHNIFPNVIRHLVKIFYMINWSLPINQILYPKRYVILEPQATFSVPFFF